MAKCDYTITNQIKLYNMTFVNLLSKPAHLF